MPYKPPSVHARRYEQNRIDRDRQRGSARERGYTTAWDKYSKARLAEHPLCVRCKARGMIVQATVTDHIKPARLCSYEEFHEPTNHQSLCTACNNRKREEDK